MRVTAMNTQKIANTAAEIEGFVKSYKREVLAPFFVNEEDRDMAEYVLLELVNNAYEHGNRKDPQKKITIEWRADPDKLLIAVEDEGEGWAPHIPETPPPLSELRGRGLWSIRQDAESFEYCNNGKKAIVTLNARRT